MLIYIKIVKQLLQIQLSKEKKALTIILRAHRKRLKREFYATSRSA